MGWVRNRARNVVVANSVEKTMERSVRGAKKQGQATREREVDWKLWKKRKKECREVKKRKVSLDWEDLSSRGSRTELLLGR